MRAHHYPVNFALVGETQDLIRRQTGPDNNFAPDAGCASPLGQWLQMMLLRLSCRGVVVIADTCGLRRGHDERVIDMKENQVRVELFRLRQRKGERLLVRWDLGGKQ